MSGRDSASTLRDGPALDLRSMAGSVLLVEDEPSVGELVQGYLGRDGYRVIWVRSGEEALAELERHSVRLVILDIGLPGIDGFEVCREIRARSQVPILMLTARDEEPDRIVGLEVGADDYLTKPFSPRELVARMKAILRRAEPQRTQEVLRLGDVSLNRETHDVTTAGELVELTAKEFDLLAFFLSNPGAVLSRDVLLDRVWGIEYPGGTRTVDVHVAQLRRKLRRPGPDPHAPGQRLQGGHLVRTLRGRLFAAMLAALALTLALTIATGAVLTRQQVDRSQVTALSGEADALALLRRSSVSYEVSDTVSGGIRTIYGYRSKLAAYVPNADRSSNGETTFAGRQYIYSYRTIPSRGLLLLRLASVKSAAWRPFLRDLLLAALAGAALAAALAFVVARSIVRPIRRVAGASRALAAGEMPTRLPEDGSLELASLAQAFNEMAEQLAASRESERSFLLSVSHELKTPLTAIRGYAEGLSEGVFPAADASRTILVEARRLERLVRDLLDLARMNRHEFSVRRETVDLAEVAREAVARHEAPAREFGVALSAAGEPTWVEADHDRVLQVASNLVENALRETPAGGSVTVRTAPGCLMVSDTGPGLAPADLEHAFDRFFLYDKYGRERPVGSGLGLAIVKQLSEAMGGTVAVDAAPGGGASFVVRLPPAARPRGFPDLEVGPVGSAARSWTEPRRVDDLEVRSDDAVETM